MTRILIKVASLLAILTLSAPSLAQDRSQYGSASEAKAMLMKAVSAVKMDKNKAIEMFNSGEGGFRDRDLYVFCSQVADGKIVALGNLNAKKLIGTDARALKDANGKMYGLELFAAEQKPAGQITEVTYMFAKPGADPTPVSKVSFVTNAGDLGCGVGYYK